MSARRRQETIARFSVPLKEDEPTVLPTSESAPSSRRRTRSKRALDIDGDVIVNDDKDDGDYVAQGDDDDDDDSDDDSDDESSSLRDFLLCFLDLFLRGFRFLGSVW